MPSVVALCCVIWLFPCTESRDLRAAGLLDVLGQGKLVLSLVRIHYFESAVQRHYIISWETTATQQCIILLHCLGMLYYCDGNLKKDSPPSHGYHWKWTLCAGVSSTHVLSKHPCVFTRLSPKEGEHGGGGGGGGMRCLMRWVCIELLDTMQDFGPKLGVVGVRWVWVLSPMWVLARRFTVLGWWWLYIHITITWFLLCLYGGSNQTTWGNP